MFRYLYLKHCWIILILISMSVYCMQLPSTRDDIKTLNRLLGFSGGHLYHYLQCHLSFIFWTKPRNHSKRILEIFHNLPVRFFLNSCHYLQIIQLKKVNPFYGTLHYFINFIMMLGNNEYRLSSIFICNFTTC